MRNLPEVTSTSAERSKALQESKSLIGKIQQSPFNVSRDAVDVLSMLRVAEYITVGHDYLDTHEETPEDTK